MVFTRANRNKFNIHRLTSIEHVKLRKLQKRVVLTCYLFFDSVTIDVSRWAINSSIGYPIARRG
jgi:hypothetical protein